MDFFASQDKASRKTGLLILYFAIAVLLMVASLYVVLVLLLTYANPGEKGPPQVDFFQPKNFDLTYVTSKGTKVRPVMIHRAIYGSFERFFGILLEHYKGKFPFWLAPIQMKVLTITDEQKVYAHNLMNTLKEHGYRVSIDKSSDPISGQIKTAQSQQIPCMLVLGKKEVANNTVTIRYRDGKQDHPFGVQQPIAGPHMSDN